MGGPNDGIISYLGRDLLPWDREIELIVATPPGGPYYGVDRGFGALQSRKGSLLSKRLRHKDLRKVFGSGQERGCTSALCLGRWANISGGTSLADNVACC